VSVDTYRRIISSSVKVERRAVMLALSRPRLKRSGVSE